MKLKIFLIFPLLFIFFFNVNFKIMSRTVDTSLMDKLTGKWELKFDDAVMYETWEKVSDTLYKGRSQVIKDGKVLFEEIMDLTKEADGKYYFNALIKERKIKLEVVKTENKELLYESDSDRNKVSYKFEGDKLHVRIIKREDNSIKEEFLFNRSQ
jgi:hypothetical protein